METHAAVERPDIEAILNGHVENAAMGRRYGVTRHKTDAGNAERFVDAFADVVRFDHTAGAWMWWDGKRWAADDRGIAMHLGRTVVRGIYAEAQRAEDETQRKGLAEWAQRSESAGRVKAMLELAKSDPTIATTTTAFDRDPDILNANNGIVDLRSGELFEHDPARMCSKLAPVDYRPELLERDTEGMPGYVTDGPTFAAFMAEIMSGHRDAVQYLQRLFGYGATGHMSEQILAVFTGGGGNGKGATTRLTKRTLGDYAQSAPPALIVDDGKRGGASPEIARLYGTRLLEIEETDDGDRLHESRLKWLTGGDMLVARHLFQSYFEFMPSFTPCLITNHRPRVTTGGKAIWRRLVVVPFDFEVTTRDPGIEDRLAEEVPAVLAWIVEGAMLWYEHGLPDSETVNAASAAYRSEEDRLEPFLREATNRVGTVSRSELYRAYVRWSETEGERPMTAKKFHAALRERGFEEESYRTYGELSLKSGWKNG